MKHKKEIISWIIVIISAFIAATFIKQFLFFVAKVPTESMEPTVLAGDSVVIQRTKDIKRSDVIAFRFEEDKKLMLKRVIALPGETVSMENGRVFINGNEFEESYIYSFSDQSVEPFTLSYDSYFVLGDNRKNSYDSADWEQKFITRKDIVGKAIYSFNHIK